jgi:hypothetical protein
MSSDAMAAPAPSGNPVTYDVAYPDHLNRWLNNPFLIWVKWLLAIPHFAILYALNILIEIITVIAFFSILFTKKYPRGLFDFAVNVVRWQANVYAYAAMMRDEYPPFSWDAGKYAVTFSVTYQPVMSRFAPLYKWLIVIPNVIVFFLFVIVAIFLWIIAGFAILFTGKFPRGMFDFLVGVGRWQHRINAYILLLTDVYPPFGLKP